MIMKDNIFDVSLKTIGLLHVNGDSLNLINFDAYKSYIKAMYLPEGCKVKVDFNVYETDCILMEAYNSGNILCEIAIWHPAIKYNLRNAFQA
jgi:hypothetical protein